MKTQVLKKVFNIFGNIIFTAILIFALVIVFFLVKSKIDGGTPNVAGNKVYIVLSGSMSPVFDTGSIVSVKDIKPENVAPRDIISFRDPRDSSRIITHRVVEIKKENGTLKFVTKGDANDGKDADMVPASNLIGKMNFSVPYAGYVLEFAKSKKGVMILVIVPGLLFILSQLRSVYKMVKENNKEKKTKKTEAEIDDIK